MCVRRARATRSHLQNLVDSLMSDSVAAGDIDVRHIRQEIAAVCAKNLHKVRIDCILWQPLWRKLFTQSFIPAGQG